MIVNGTHQLSFGCTQAMDPYVRVVYDSTYGLALAGPYDREVGTISERHLVTGLGAATVAGVVSNTPGLLIKMVSAGAITQYAVVYGSTDGRVSATKNPNPIGIAMQSASAAGSHIDVLRVAYSSFAPEVIGGVDFFDHFTGDYPAAGTALNQRWTKTETVGLGVTAVDDTMLKFAFDAVEEAAQATIAMSQGLVDIDSEPVLEARFAIATYADSDAVDYQIGLIDPTGSAAYAYVSVAGGGETIDLAWNSTDGTTTKSGVDTLANLTAGTFVTVKIDLTDLTDVKIFVDGTRYLATTTIDMSAFSGKLYPFVNLQKTSDDAAADMRLDWLHVMAAQA